MINSPLCYQNWYQYHCMCVAGLYCVTSMTGSMTGKTHFFGLLFAMFYSNVLLSVGVFIMAIIIAI